MALSALRTPAEVLANAAALMDPFWKTVWPDDWNDRRKDIDAILLIASEHASLDGILTAVTLDHSLDNKNDAQSENSVEKPENISTTNRNSEGEGQGMKVSSDSGVGRSLTKKQTKN